jgi:hypothetical protein
MLFLFTCLKRMYHKTNYVLKLYLHLYDITSTILETELPLMADKLNCYATVEERPSFNVEQVLL